MLDLADKYHDVTTFDRVATLAWAQAQVQLRTTSASTDEAQLFQTLGASILYRGPRRCARRPRCSRAGRKEFRRSGRTAISGDLPIVLVEIDDADDIGIVRQLCARTSTGE